MFGERGLRCSRKYQPVREVVSAGESMFVPDDRRLRQRPLLLSDARQVLLPSRYARRLRPSFRFTASTRVRFREIIELYNPFADSAERGLLHWELKVELFLTEHQHF